MRSAAAPSLCPALVLLGSLLAPAPALAQEVGFKAGVTSATISFAPRFDLVAAPPGAARRTGLIGGAFLFLPTVARGGWQFEALLHQKGARDLLRIGDEVTLTTLDLPLLVHIDVFQAGTRAVYVLIGPSLAFNLRTEYAGIGLDDDVPFDVRMMDAGFITGGGVEYHQLVVDARYTWGLRNILEQTGHDGAFEHRTFAVTAGLRLRW